MALELDEIVSRSLHLFVRDISAERWTGRREREAIGLYVLGYLIRQVRSGGPLRDVTQIGIEVPVGQIGGRRMRALSGRKGVKGCVAKDLVIWARPRMTCWDSGGRPSHSPLAIMEWKFGARAGRDYDLEWLKEYSRGRPAFTGYTVRLARTVTGFGIRVIRVRKGVPEENWLDLEGDSNAP